MKNNFIQNNMGKDSQLYGDYSTNPLLNMSENYWDDWLSPDANNDGYVDNPYYGMSYMGKDTNLIDPMPVTTPYNISIVDHFFLPPHILYPNISTLVGTISVEWRPAFDSMYDPITYNLYISNDDGVTWSTVATGITNLSYNLDTTLYPNGTMYSLKVNATDGKGFSGESISATFSIDNPSSGGGGGGSTSHTLTMPTITFPTAGITVNETITVTWNASTDSLGHTVYYTLYLSNDGGNTWDYLAFNITSTSFVWNTTEYPNGNQYILKLYAEDGFGLNVTYYMSGTFTISNIIHELTPINFLFPIGGETLNGTITVEWENSSDSLGHTVYYSLYHSPNNGVTWNLLATNLTSTTYVWNTTTVPDGTQNLLKVEAYDEYGLKVTAVTPQTFIINNTQSGSTQTPTHTLSQSVIIYPQGGDILNGTVTVVWNASSDSLGHSVVYSLYYTADDGATWNPLIENSTSTTYNWDTTTVPDGTYRLKLLVQCSQGLKLEVLSDSFTISNGNNGSKTTTSPPATIAPITNNTSATDTKNATDTTSPADTGSEPVTVQTPFGSLPLIIGILTVMGIIVIRRRPKT